MRISSGDRWRNFVASRSEARLPTSYRAGAVFTRFLVDLKDETEGIDEVAWQTLDRRLKTYVAYQELSHALAATAAGASRLLQNRPRLLVRMALVVTALSFLRAHFHFEVPERIAELIQELGDPEEIASITSFLVVLANERDHLDSLDFAFLGESYEQIDELRHLMISGKAMVEQLEVAKYLSLFGYELEVFPTEHPTFCLRPPSPEFEYSMRLGYIRAQTNAEAN